MANLALLNNVDHHDLRLSRKRGAANGETVNQVRVFPTEFRALQREYPLFFRRADDGAFYTVAILGLDRDENLFLEERDGSVEWTTRPLPAILDRGPFSIGTGNTDDSQNHVIMVDLDHPWIGRDEGELLFRSHGGNAADLDRAAGTLRLLHQGVAIETAMFQAFHAADLLAYLDVTLRLDESTEYKLPELYTIRPDALRNLEGDALRALNASGFLELATYVMASHDNLNRLTEIKNQRRGIL